MGYEQRFVWKCDICEWTWIPRKDGKEPECCPNRKCRSRKWNTPQPAFVEYDPRKETANEVGARIRRERSELVQDERARIKAALVPVNDDEAFKLALREKFKNFVKKPAGV